METFNVQLQSGFQGPIIPMLNHSGRPSRARAHSNSNPTTVAVAVGTFPEVFFLVSFLCKVISTVSFVARKTSAGTARDCRFENYLHIED